MFMTNTNNESEVKNSGITKLKQMTLYEINAESAALMKMILDAETDEEMSAIEAMLNANTVKWKENLNRWFWVIKRFKSDIKFLSDEIKRFTELRKSRESTVKRMESAIKYSLNNRALTKVSTAHHSATIANSTPSVEILVPISELPETMVKTQTIVEPDKAVIKSHADENGLVFVDNRLVAKIVRGTHIRYR